MTYNPDPLVIPPEDEFDEMKRLLARFPDAAVHVNQMLDAGAPFLRAEINEVLAPRARYAVTGLQPAEWLKEYLATLRARDFNPDEIVGTAGCVIHRPTSAQSEPRLRERAADLSQSPEPNDNQNRGRP